MMNWSNLFSDINFWISTIGSVLLGAISGMVGSISVLRKQSLIGDGIGHSVLPGIILSYMVFQSRSPLLLMLGAILFGLISFGLIELFNLYSKTTLNTALAIVLSSMFGLGMVLKSNIQGNVKYQSASQAGLDKYIFGQAAFTSSGDVLLIVIVALINLCLLLAFRKELKLFVFDREFCAMAGFNPQLISIVVLISSLSLISVGLRIVGAILIASMLVAPTVAALQWTDRFYLVWLLSALFGGFSAFLGSVLATQGFPNGPVIIVMMTFFTLISFLLGKHGALKKWWHRQTHKQALKKQVGE